MQGMKSGLAALLKRSHPNILVVHCLAHRLELAFKDTIKKTKAYDKLLTLLLGLYYLYRRSPKLTNGLKATFEALKMRPVLPTRVGGTRWLPHISLAIGNFVNAYKAIRLHLETASHNNAKAEGLVKIAADTNVIGYMLSLKEVITPLVRLSLNIQKEGPTLADASMYVQATKSLLTEQYNVEYDSIKAVFTDGLYQGEHVTVRGALSKTNHVKEIAE